MKAEGEVALQLTGTGPRDYRPRAAEALTAFFDSVVIARVCPQASLPRPWFEQHSLQWWGITHGIESLT